MDIQVWSWLLTLVGLAGFVLAGRKVWWAWHVALANQVIWVGYAISTEQWGFLACAVVFTFVFGKNAIDWTREHKAAKAEEEWIAGHAEAFAEYEAGLGERFDSADEFMAALLDDVVPRAYVELGPLELNLGAIYISDVSFDHPVILRLGDPVQLADVDGSLHDGAVTRVEQGMYCNRYRVEFSRRDSKVASRDQS